MMRKAALLLPIGVLLLVGMTGCPSPSSPTGNSAQPKAYNEATEGTLAAAIPDDSFRLSIGKESSHRTETVIQRKTLITAIQRDFLREFLIDVPSSARRITVTWGASSSSLPLSESSETARRCAFSASWQLTTEDGSDDRKVKGTWSLTTPKESTTSSFESELVEETSLLDVVALKAEPGLHKLGEPVALGSLTGQEMTLYVLQQEQDAVPDAD